MRSGLRRLLNQGPPVSYTGRGVYNLPTMPGYNDNESYQRTFGTSGTVWSIVSTLATATATSPWHLYRKQPVDGRRRYTTGDHGSDQRTEVVNHQALSVLNHPACIKSRSGLDISIWTTFQLFEVSQIHLELTGESWWVLEKDPRANFPLGIWPVSPHRMEVVPSPTGYLQGYVYTAPDGEKVPLELDDVILTKYPNPLDPYRGLGPVQAVLVDIDAAKYSAEWNRNFFLNSATPGGIIQVDKRLTDEEWDEMTNRWREQHRGVSRAHRIAVLEQGATWVPNAHESMKDMDFAKLRDTSRDVIREAWGIHKSMIGNSDDVNRANAETAEEVFSTWKIEPRLNRWRETLNHQFLPLFGSAGESVEFDYEGLNLTSREQDNNELQTKAAAAAQLVNAGYDPADVLEAVGLPDMGVVEKATQAPALPPHWVPEQQALPAGGPDQPDETDMTARLRRMLSNGHVPVQAGRTQ